MPPDDLIPILSHPYPSAVNLSDLMDTRLDKLSPLIGRITPLLTSAASQLAMDRRIAAERWRGDADALRFHLDEVRKATGRPPNKPRLVAILGGTGTGKSTLVNRLLGRPVTATSFRRTFTTGAVAIAEKADDLPAGWLGLEHVVVAPEALPAKGQSGALMVVELGLVGARPASPDAGADRADSQDTPGVAPTIIDTPDLDGDQPAHHAQADRVFRWAQAVVFLVTPEKYQMTELLPYYRLARRYAAPTLHVMNKCEEQAAVEDYRQQLMEGAVAADGANQEATRFDKGTSPLPQLPTAPRVFAVPRDDATYEPPAEMNLAALRSAIGSIPAPEPDVLRAGLNRRAGDVLGRLSDQVIAPLKDDRRDADAMIASLRGMEAPASPVDVNPVTQQLQRRLQQRSILYLMGPQRVMDRVRQAPTLLARLPRVAWDYLRRGEISAELLGAGAAGGAQQAPDFHAILMDQFAVVQSRIDDVLRSTSAGQRWIDGDGQPYTAARIDPAEAGKIADEELADLRTWLEKKWNATPRDTRMLETMLKYLPGGRKLARWSEAAPYLLTIVLVTHHAFFGPVDLLVLGGYGLATWLTERLSNEVTSRTRATNARIEQRFAALAHDQLRRSVEWLEKQAPSKKLSQQLEDLEQEFAEIVGAT